ncbi:MAG: exosortase system-associated protein, TIGR04073 family [Verrucomicrobiota bacterium]
MRNTICLLSVIALLGLLSSGCANMERKLGRGLSNTTEIVRAGEFRRSMEQAGLYEDPDVAYTYGSIHGINRSLARTGIGLYEVATFPFPPYRPVFTRHFAPNPVYPDNYKPNLVEDSMYATDTYTGFSGGDTFPFLPGSRFQIFETR